MTLVVYQSVVVVFLLFLNHLGAPYPLVQRGNSKPALWSVSALHTHCCFGPFTCLESVTPIGIMGLIVERWLPDLQTSYLAQS